MADLDAIILKLVAACGPGKSICPTEAAKAADPEAWRAWLRPVRGAAVGLARQGRISILRKGKPVDPNDFRGVYRLGAPSLGAPIVGETDDSELAFSEPNSGEPNSGEPNSGEPNPSEPGLSEPSLGDGDADQES